MTTQGDDNKGEPSAGEEPSVEAGGDAPAQGKKPASASAGAGAGSDPSPERTRMLMVGAVLIGVAAVAALWWWERGQTNSDVAGATEQSTEPQGESPQEGPVNPFGPGSEQQPPSPIPAPPDVAAPPEDAGRSESGLAWRVLEEGTGDEHPAEGDIVTINYTGWTTEGQMVDSSVVRGEPATLPLERAVPGWIEGLQLMVAGEKRRFWVPPELADTGRGPPPGPIVFDMELVAFREAPPPPAAPPNVSAPPPSAERTASGLAFQVLEEGDGDQHPTPASRVRAHFSSWTTDGELLDSSLAMGEPATLPPLQHVVPGMREGLELMVVGEKRRLWVPEELAFAGRPGAPEGMIVFDIELVEILEPPPGAMPGLPGQPPGPARPPPSGGPPG